MADQRFETALAAARAYSAAIDGRREMDLERFLVAVHRAVSALYAAVLALPDIEPSDTEYPDRWSHDEWWALYHDLKDQLGPIDRYREIFNPYEDESKPPVVGSLADAIADVYGSVVRAVRVADVGTLADAAFELQLEFEIKAGHYAVDALRAIQAHRFDRLPE